MIKAPPSILSYGHEYDLFLVVFAIKMFEICHPRTKKPKSINSLRKK